MPSFGVRTAGPADRPLLERMLWLAVHWDAAEPPPLPEPLPAVLVPYVDGLATREGDFALVAEEDGEAVGAAWYRLLSGDEPGYGFVSADVPELSVAVLASRRGGGIGSALLDRLVESARGDGRPGLSLSARGRNPARMLYARMGFAEVGAVDDSLTMLLRFSPPRLG